MEEQEFLISLTKQIAVKAINHDEALKKVINGEGKIASVNMSANPRPQPVAQGIQTSRTIAKTPTNTITATVP